MTPRPRAALLIVGLVSCEPFARSRVNETRQESAGVMTRADFRARVGVDCITPGLLEAAFDTLPIGFYRDYHALGWAHAGAPWAGEFGQTYLPELQYKGIGDAPEVREVLRAAAASGAFPIPAGVEADELIELLALAGVEEWLVDRTRDGTFPPGTWFLLGNEPGYSDHDPRTPAQIVDDALRIRELFERHALGHRLALGGLSSSDTAHSRRSYGMAPMEFFEAILRSAAERDLVFDAYATHPYPISGAEGAADLQDLAGPSELVQDSVRQVRALRSLLMRYGHRDVPLWVTEVGLPFPGAGPDEAAGYLDGFLTWCLTATDDVTGKRDDGDRLVQRFQWFLLAEPTEPMPGYTDNPALALGHSVLLDADGEPTALGRRLQAVADRLAPVDGATPPPR